MVGFVAHQVEFCEEESMEWSSMYINSEVIKE